MPDFCLATASRQGIILAGSGLDLGAENSEGLRRYLANKGETPPACDEAFREVRIAAHNARLVREIVAKQRRRLLREHVQGAVAWLLAGAGGLLWAEVAHATHRPPLPPERGLGLLSVIVVVAIVGWLFWPRPHEDDDGEEWLDEPRHRPEQTARDWEGR